MTLSPCQRPVEPQPALCSTNATGTKGSAKRETQKITCVMPSRGRQERKGASVMKWSLGYPVLRAGKARCRLLLSLVLITSVVLSSLSTAAQPAGADTTGTAGTGITNPGCDLVLGASFSPGCLPPDLLTLSGLYAATPAQADSLQLFESQAVQNVITAHSLSPGDGNAVLSWGRSDAEAELLTLIEQAITDCSTTCTPDEQNVVDWVQAVEGRQALTAAEDAGYEYVKWAGLDEGMYQALLNTNPSESALEAFFSTPGYPVSYSPFTIQTGSGYCAYQSPAPDGTDYKEPTTDATCYGQPPPIGYVPVTPTFQQFTKWGEDDANYSLLDTGAYFSAAATYGTGTVFGLIVASLISAQALGSQAAKVAARAAGLDNLDTAILKPTSSSPSSTVSNLTDTETAAEASEGAEAADSSDALDLAAVLDGIDVLGAATEFLAVTIVLAAVEAAIMEGINVFTAAALPGKLATLITNAETPPDPATLQGESDGQATLYELFVGATLPTPTDQTCDNSAGIPAGVTVVDGFFSAGSYPPCLNPTPIPPASATDPQFVVQEKGGTLTSTASSISWQDAAAGTTSTTRLSGNWFVTNEATQSLSITYTDWAGNEQVAWLVGSASAGYQFLGYNLTAGSGQTINTSTCYTDGLCSVSPTIDYVGSDGNDYSASVQPPGSGTSVGTVSGDNPTGFPTWGPAVEGSPVDFSPNTFGPLDAFDAQGQVSSPITYTWQFQQTVCNVGCLQTNVGAPDYTTPITSSGGTDYTFPTSGTYAVLLTATDANGEQAVDSFNVTVGDVPPTLTLSPDCPAAQCNARTVPVGATTDLAGMVSHTGTQDVDDVYVDWGDASSEDTAFCGLVVLPGGGECNPGSAVPGTVEGLFFDQTPLALTADPTNTQVALSDSHTYASAGTYYATVTVSDQSGATVSRTIVETVTNPVPTVARLTPTSTPIGSSPTITVTGAGFGPFSSLDWNGAPLTTTYVGTPVATLTAQLPASDTSGATVGVVTVVNPAPGGGTSIPQFVYVVPAQSGVAAANVATSQSDSGSATASVGGSGAGTAASLSAAASGGGTVAVAEYSADPETSSPPTATNAYFNVSVPASSVFTSMQVTDCNLAGGSVVYYSDDTTGQWAEVTGQTYDASTGCVTFTLSDTTAPSLAQLSGVVFGVQDAPPSLTLPTDPADSSVPYHGTLTFPVSASDPQGNAITLSATGLPSGLVLTDNGDGSWTVAGPATAAPGSYTATITASAGVASTSQQMTITVTRAASTVNFTGPSLVATNRPATLSAVLEEGGGAPPVPDGQPVTLTLGSGSSMQSCQGLAQADGLVSCQIANVNQALGNQPVSATFDGDSYYGSSSDTSQHALVFSYLPAGGGFALGDQAVKSATPTTAVTWWGSQWAKLDPLSGGSAPASFKGFAQTFHNGSATVTDPACGGTFTELATGGAAPPASVPAYMAVVVPAQVTKSGNTISGNIAEVVIVKTNPGYQPDPNDPGTGTVVATLCGS